MPIASVSTRTSPSESGGSGTSSSRVEFGTPGEIVRARIGCFPDTPRECDARDQSPAPITTQVPFGFDGGGCGLGRARHVHPWANDGEAAAGPYCNSVICSYLTWYLVNV